MTLATEVEYPVTLLPVVTNMERLFAAVFFGPVVVVFLLLLVVLVVLFLIDVGLGAVYPIACSGSGRIISLYGCDGLFDGASGRRCIVPVGAWEDWVDGRDEP